MAMPFRHMLAFYCPKKEKKTYKKKKRGWGYLSILSFVDKVNSPFAPNVELFGSDV